MDQFVQKIQHFVRRHSLIERGDSIVVAVSGGVDSVVMFDLLASWKTAWDLTIAAAHVNHGLRGEESDMDEQFVRGLAGSYGIDCHVERVDTSRESRHRKLSIQEAARNLRYAFLADLRVALGYTSIATAHNADDNAETILLNLIRGAGVQGMAGIPRVRADVHAIRPLLGVSRLEILAYAKEKHLAYRTDSSNAKEEYTRNFLRHSVIPLLEDNVNPGIIATLNRTSDVFRSLNDYLLEEAGRALPEIAQKRNNEVIIDIPNLARKRLFLQEYCVLVLMRECSGREVDFASVKTMLRLTEAETGSSFAFGRGFVAVRDRNRLVLRRDSQATPFSYRIEPNKSYEFEDFSFASAATESYEHAGDRTVEYVDADRIGPSLILRNWVEGDWFYPLGMKGKKKLSDFFVDVKIPVFEKQSIPVLETDGAIVWVCGQRIDERFKVGPATKHVLRLEYSPKVVPAG